MKISKEIDQKLERIFNRKWATWKVLLHKSYILGYQDGKKVKHG